MLIIAILAALLAFGAAMLAVRKRQSDRRNRVKKPRYFSVNLTQPVAADQVDKTPQ